MKMPTTTAQQHAARVLEGLARIDDMLAAKGWPRLSPWWARQFRRFYKSGRRRSVWRVGRRGGKSSSILRLIAAEMLYGDHNVPPGDIGVAVGVSVSKEEARARLVTLEAMLRDLGVAFRPASFGDGIDLVGRPIGFRVFAATIAGVRGATAICLFFDEVALWSDRETGSNPATHVLRSARPMTATMPQAREFMSSSPFSTLDAHAEAFDRGETDEQIVAFAPTWEANPEITEARTRELEPDEPTRLREYGAIPMDAAGTTWFDSAAVEAATDPAHPLARKLQPGEIGAAGADFAFVNDASALAVVHRDGEGVYHVGELFELHPQRGAPLKPSDVCNAFAGVIGRHGLSEVYSDGHYKESIREHLDKAHLRLAPAPEGNSGKIEQYTEARVVLHEGRLRLPEHRALKQQLHDVVVRPTPGGSLSIASPRRAGGGHGDLTSALVLAIWALKGAARWDEYRRAMNNFATGNWGDEGFDTDGETPMQFDRAVGKG